MDVTLTANDAAATTYTLVDASSPWKLVVWDWGNAVWDQQFSGARGTLGARPSHSQVQNRPVAIGLRLLPASKAALPGHLADLGHVVEQMRRYGGLIAVTTDAVTYVQYLAVLSGSAALQPWTNRAEWSGRVDYALTFMCEPYVRGASMEVVDGFASDSTGDYTYDDGAATDVAVSGGELTPVNPATAVTAIHTAVGYSYGDVRVGVTGIVGTTLTSFKAGVVLKRTADGTHLEVYVDDNGANSRLRIDKVVAAARTNLATTNLGARVAASRPFRVVGHIQGNVVTAEHYLDVEAAAFRPTPTTTTSTTLTSTDITAFGHQATGQCGYVWTAQQAAARLDDLVIQPFAYLSQPQVGVRRLSGAIPGDAAALIEMEAATASGTGSPEFAALAVTRDRPTNLIVNGSFEYPSIPAMWGVGAVTGVTGAATSMTAVATAARYGSQCAEIVTPATANTGAHARIYGPFRAGVTYRAEAYIRAASSTTNTRLRLGVNGDIASETATALTSTWTRRTVDWTPTADAAVAFFALEVTAATLTTMQIDAAMVYEGTSAPELEGHQRGGGGEPPSTVLTLDTAWLTSEVLTTVTAAWPYLTTRVLREPSASETSMYAEWIVDASAVDPDVHDDTVDVEVWACLVSPATFVGGKVTAYTGSYGTAYTRETGEAGVSVAASSTGLYRIGTVVMDRTAAGPTRLNVAVSWSSGSGNVDLAWVMVLPARRRALWVSGFALGADSLVRTMPDGSAQIRDDNLFLTGWEGTAGAGQMLTADPGATRLVWAFTSGYEPSGGVLADTTAATLRLIRVTPTPRWHHLRDA